MRCQKPVMRVLTYIRKVLEIYASGDEDYLSRSLSRDIGPDPTPHEEQVHALISNVEEQGALIAQLLAGGRMNAEPGVLSRAE